MFKYLVLLSIIPLLCWFLTKIFIIKNKWLLCGFSIGLVIAPISYGLLQFTYVPIIGKLLGLIGLVLNLTHGSVGYFFFAGYGFFESGMPLSSVQFFMINLVNAVIFSSCYGLIGSTIDNKIEEKKKYCVALES